MPDVIKAALTTELAIRDQSSAMLEAPKELQYMPPGTHRINASRGGQPVSLDITVDASTADRLNQFLQDQLTKATEGNDDRPFFDFNHEDREAAAWPTEFYWAGEDPITGGVRAKIEWSGAGEKAVKEKTFRRFSPTFVPDEAGHVIGSETNMGGLVNRAAFKTIAPLFAKGDATQVSGLKSHPSNPPQVSGLKSHPSNPPQVSGLSLHPSELSKLDESTIQAIETRLDQTLDLVQAFSDEARAASERARRALGWPGLSQTWGRRGHAGPHRKPFDDPNAPEGDEDQAFQDDERRAVREASRYRRQRMEQMETETPEGDADQAFQDDERRAMEDASRRQRERMERMETETPSTGDSNPEFEDEERSAMDEASSERQRRIEEQELGVYDQPGQTFEEIANDPQALRRLSDQDLEEFQYFTEGETLRRFQEEAARRRTQVLPRAN